MKGAEKARVSEFFLVKFRPVVDAVLNTHGLAVPDTTRDMLANTIAHNRELPMSNPKPLGSRSALPTLRTARTHAKKLIEYVAHPPTRKVSVPLRCAKLAAAVRGNKIAGMTLAMESVGTNALLDSLDAGNVTAGTLRRLVRMIDKIEKQHERERKKGAGIGRPWAAHTRVIRAGCIAWQRAGYRIGYQWNDDTATLTGALPEFLRDLIECCAGTHVLTTVKPRAAPAGYRDPTSPPRGNALRSRTPDRVVRDGIRAWQTWCKKHPAKTRTFSA